MLFRLHIFGDFSETFLLLIYYLILLWLENILGILFVYDFKLVETYDSLYSLLVNPVCPWKGCVFCSSVQFSSVAQLCPTLCDPMNRSTTGLPVHHQLPEFIQTHAHRVGDAIQPSHPLLSASPAPSPSQHQGLFQ